MLLANLMNITHGMAIAWFITNENHFFTVSTPLQVPPLSHNEVKWINSSFYCGSLIGTIFLTLTGDVFGRKNTLTVMIIPLLVIFIS